MKTCRKCKWWKPAFDAPKPGKGTCEQPLTEEGAPRSAEIAYESEFCNQWEPRRSPPLIVCSVDVAALASLMKEWDSNLTPARAAKLAYRTAGFTGMRLTNIPADCFLEE